MAEPDQTPNTPPADPAAQETAAPAVDVQAEIDKAAAAAKQQAQSEFSAQLKELTGHDSLKALHEAQLAEQGKTQELLDARTQEAAKFKNLFESSQIKAALLAAAGDAVYPDVVVELLTARANCDEAGNVTIDGKPAGEAVTALLAEKPALAKSSGSAGSGAPAKTGTATVNPWADESWNLTEQVKIKRENPSLAVQLKAAAGK